MQINLFVTYVMLAKPFLVFAAMNTDFCQTLISRIENYSCSACGHATLDTSCLILFWPITDTALVVPHRFFFFIRPLLQVSEVARFLRLYGFAVLPSFGRGRLTTAEVLDRRTSAVRLFYHSLNQRFFELPRITRGKENVAIVRIK